MPDQDAYKAFVSSAPSKDDLQAIGTLAMDLLAAELVLATAELAYKNAQALVRNIAEQQLPEAMAGAGMKEFTTTGGIKIKIKDGLRISIPEANKETCFQWLEKNGQGGIIKKTVKIAFGRGDADKAKLLVAELVEQEYSVAVEDKVEPPTLNKLLRDRLKAGSEVPLELFGAQEFKVAEIKRDGKESVFGE